MRSVENGVPLVRSANNGISFIVDAYGRVLHQTRLDVQTVLYGTVPRPLPPTPYRRWGDWFIAACALATLVAVITKTAGGIAARRKNRPPAA
jgi:apolipoprotein N-acyltransferase